MNSTTAGVKIGVKTYTRPGPFLFSNLTSAHTGTEQPKFVQSLRENNIKNPSPNDGV